MPSKSVIPCHSRPYLFCFAFALVGAAALLRMPVTAADDEPARQPVAERIESSAIENLYRLSPRIYSGAQPEGQAGFERLKGLGVRTIITVDGAAPDVKGAREQGLRYVHLPIGYDGIPPARALALVKAVRELPGPVFIHCHHGKHRGPAAAALCAAAVEGWSREKGAAWMRQAGTSGDYRGLFQSVARLPIPTEQELKDAPAEFPEKAPVSTLVETMVRVDREWDLLKARRETGFRPAPAGEVTASQAALQLTEQYRELARSSVAAERGIEFAAVAREAEQAAEQLEQALRRLAASGAAADREAVQAAFTKASRSCTACHSRFRDVPQ